MPMFLRHLPLALTLALGVAAGAHAQAKRDTTYLPVWNQNNGKLEYLLQLEPADRAGVRWKSGANTFDATVGLDGNDGLGLVCDRKSGLAGAIGNLANHCLLASLDDDRDGNNRQFSAGASLSRPGGRVGVALGNGRETLPGWLSPNSRPSRVDQNTLTVYGQKNIGREAMVSIGGTWAKAKLIPAGEMPNLADHWNSKSITLGAAYGNFGANIVGRVVDKPGQPGQWEGLGLGLTWRTPWSGQLTVGAENVITRGKNPFAPDNGDKDEGTVPYVRYEQDL